LTIGRGSFGLACLCLFALAAIVGPGAAGAAGCPNEELRTGASAALPECRAYEMVSPPDKSNGDVEPRGALPWRGLAGTDENGYAFLSVNGLPGSESGALDTGNVAKRNGDGWTSFSVTAPETNKVSVPFLMAPLRLSPDLDHALVASRVPLTPDSQPGNNIYVRTISPPSLQLITPIPLPTEAVWNPSLLDIIGASDDFSHVVFQSHAKLTPDATQQPFGTSRQNVYEWNGSTLENIGILPGETEPSSLGIGGGFAVSPDGGRVILEGHSEAHPGSPAFWLRDHGTTILVGAPDAGEKAYAGASTDLSKIFIYDAGSLYRYDVEAAEKVHLADGVRRENFLASPNGEAVYFAGNGVLAPGGTAGVPNLYRWSEADGIEFVSRLSSSDAFLSGTVGAFVSVEAATNGTGNAVAFVSQAAPTGQSPVGVKEMYHWSKSEGLACVSCVSGLASPAGATMPLPNLRPGAGNPVSADGTKAFFSTTDRLVPADTNGKLDAYEWVGGAVHLISTGSGNYGAEFLDASPSAKDVFFVTRDQLVGADRDEGTDVYDAREGGGFAEPPLAVPCEAEACRPPLEAVPPAPQIGSRSFDGPGTPSQNSGKKPHKKKHKHHKKHARKHHKKAHKQNKKKAKACKAKTKRCPRGSHHGHTAGKRG
jgi:hypothetical protein